MTFRRGASAFTLLEVLVAVILTVALAALMLVVTTNVLSLWQRTQDSYAQTVSGKLVLDTIEQDFQTAIHRTDPTKWFAADILDTTGELTNHGWLVSPGAMKPSDGGSLRPLPEANSAGTVAITDARFGLSGVWLRFIASNVESGGTLPSLIAYQIVRRPVVGDVTSSNSAPIRYSLYRSAITTSDTFSQGYDVTSSNYSSSDNSPYSNSSTHNREPRNVMNPSHANLLASNVVDFGCWLYRRNSDGSLLMIYPENPSDHSHIALGDSTVNSSRFPDVADVMVRVLSEEGATLIEALETGRLTVRPTQYSTPAEWWWGIVESHSQVFSRRIELKGAAL